MSKGNRDLGRMNLVVGGVWHGGQSMQRFVVVTATKVCGCVAGLHGSFVSRVNVEEGRRQW